MAPAPAPLPAAGRARLSVIFLTVLIDLIGFGIILPILPVYAKELGAGGFGFGALIGVYSLMQFVSTSVLGKLSDRLGRRPVLLATMLLNAGGYLLFGFARTYALLFASRVISGFAGGNLSVAQAYIGDITSPAERSKGMGVIGAAFGIGFVLGPAIGGVFGKFVSPASPLFVAAGISLVNFALASRILPESLAEHHRVSRPLLDFGHLARALEHRRLRPLMIVWFLAPFAFAGYTVAFPIYANARFGWDEGALAVYFFVAGFVSALTQGWLFGRLRRLASDRAMVIVGMAIMVAAVAVIPYLGTALGLYAWGGVLAFGNSLVAPAASGLVSVLADPSEQGAVLGAAQSLSSLGRFGGPWGFGAMYDRLSPAAAFLGAAAAMLLGAAAALGIARETPPAGGRAGA